MESPRAPHWRVALLPPQFWVNETDSGSPPASWLQEKDAVLLQARGLLVTEHRSPWRLMQTSVPHICVHLTDVYLVLYFSAQYLLSA